MTETSVPTSTTIAVPAAASRLHALRLWLLAARGAVARLARPGVRAFVDRREAAAFRAARREQALRTSRHTPPQF